MIFPLILLKDLFVKVGSHSGGNKIPAANLYVLDVGHDFSPGFVMGFEPQKLNWI